MKINKINEKIILRFAIQKSGRLAEGCQKLLLKCGIKNQSRRNQLVARDEDFGVEFLFVRDDDIPGMIENGVCDIGIFGQNLLDEYNLKSSIESSNLKSILPLEFSKCRLSIAAPKEFDYISPKDLNGKIIATSYPHTLRKFLATNNIEANIVTLHGSVELASHIGVADLICDLVSSGDTLYENGLREILNVSISQAILVQGRAPLSQEKSALIDRLMLRMKSVQAAEKNRYIMMHLDRNRIDQLAKILPGSEAPTVLLLKDSTEKVALHVVSHEEVFWDTLEKLKKIGATSILVMPIEKMIS